MPRVPTAEFSGRISSDVAGGQIDSATSDRIQNKSLAELGEGIANFGTGLGNYLNRQQEKEDNDMYTVMRTKFDSAVFENKKINRERLQGTKFEGYAKENSKFIDQTGKQLLREATSDKQKELFNFYVENTKLKEASEDAVIEHSERQGFLFNEKKNAIRSKAEMSFSNPTLSNVLHQYDTARSDAQAEELIEGGLSPEKKQELQEGLKEIFKSGAYGALSSGSNARINEHLNLLKGKTNPEIIESSGLSGREKAVLIKSLENALEVNNNVLINKTVDQAKEVSNASLNDLKFQGRIDPGLQQQRKALIDSLEFANELKPSEKVKTAIKDLKEVSALEVLNLGLSSMKMQDLNTFDTPSFVKALEKEGMVFDQAFNSKVDSFIKDYKKIAEEDPATIVSRSKSNVQEGSMDMIKYQEEMGVKNPQLLTEKKSQFIKSMLDNSKNKSQTVEELFGPMELRQSSIMEFAYKNPEYSYVGLASILPNTSKIEADKLLGLDAKTIKENFKLAEKNENTIDKELNKQMNEFLSAYGDDFEYKAGIVNSLKLAAMEKSSKGINEEDAVEQVFNTYIDKNFSVVRTKRSNVIVPKTKQNNPDTVESFIDFYSDPSNAKTMTEKLNLSDNFKNEVFAETVMGSDIYDFKWVTTPDHGGLKPVMFLPEKGTGILKKVILKDKNGKDVFIRFDEMDKFLPSSGFMKSFSTLQGS